MEATLGGAAFVCGDCLLRANNPVGWTRRSRGREGSRGIGMTAQQQAVTPLGEILNKREKWLLLVSLMLAMFVGAIDQTVVSTATPKILADLGGFGLLSWLFTSYMLSSTVVVPLVGKLSDVFGRRVFVITGILIFMLASAACGAAPSMPALIVFRGVQGFGGGMIFASVFSTIGDIFPPAERGKYMGMFTGTFSLASVLGPTFGGFLTDNGGWRWVFYVNVPFSLIAIPAIWMNLPSRKGVRRPKIDFLGAGLLSSFSVLFLLALVWAGDEYAWSSPQIVGLISASLVFLGLFVLQETRHPEPMVPLHLFRNRAFVISNLIVFTLGIGMFGALQYLSLFVQTALGATATASGIITTPQSFGMLGASIIGGQVISRTGRYRIQTITGSIVILSAMLFLRTLDVDVVRWHISAWMVVLGVGFGLVMPTMSLATQNAVPYQYLGVASSSSQFFRQIGSVFGVAVFGALLASSYHNAFSDQLPVDTKAALGPQTVEQFDDPTLPLNPREYAIVQRKVLALDGGQQLLSRTVATQKESVATAVRLIFTGATVVAVICIGMALLMREVPLRRGFGHADEGVGAPAAVPQGNPAVAVAAPGASDVATGREGAPGG